MRQQTAKIIRTAYQLMPEYIGVRVGMLCVNGDVPLPFVQGIVKVSTPTIYRWVEGQTDPTTATLVNKLKRVEWMLTRAIEDGVLPSEDKFDPRVVLPYWKQSLTATKNK